MAKFIGGNSDGAKFSVARNQRFVQLPSTDRGSIRLVFDRRDPIADGPIKYEEYRLERIAGDKQVFEVYVHSSVTVDEMLYRLIEHYRTVEHDGDRRSFEAAMAKRDLPIGRHQNSDGGQGEYRNCAVQLAWEVWMESNLREVER